MASSKKANGNKTLKIVIILALVCTAAVIVCAVTGVFGKKEAGGNNGGADTAKTETAITDENGETVAAPASDTSAATNENGETAAASDSGSAEPAETAEPVGPDEQDSSSKVSGNGAIISGNGDNSAPAATGADAISGNTGTDGSTNSYSYTFEKLTDEGVPPEGGKISMELNYPVFSGSTVNVSPLNDEIAAKMSVTKDSYARMLSSDGESDTETYCRFGLECKIVNAGDSFISILMTTNTAIGTTSKNSYTTVNYDFNSGKAIYLYDLFPEDADYEVTLSEAVGSNQQIDAGKFLLSPEGLTLFTVSAKTEPSQVTVPFSALDGIILDEYKLS